MFSSLYVCVEQNILSCTWRPRHDLWSESPGVLPGCRRSAWRGWCWDIWLPALLPASAAPTLREEATEKGWRSVWDAMWTSELRLWCYISDHFTGFSESSRQTHPQWPGSPHRESNTQLRVRRRILIPAAERASSHSSSWSEPSL